MDDHYPDENEEFELQYQEELEMLDDFPPDEITTTNTEETLKSSKNAQNRGFVVALENFNSPQLSQISLLHDDSALAAAAPPAARRLFGTPIGPQRGASTPMPTKARMPSIQEVVSLSTEQEQPTTSRAAAAIAAAAVAATAELQQVGLCLRSKRRLERDLFGDIDDLYYNERTENPQAKKARIKDEREVETIDLILAERRRLREATNNLRTDNLSRQQELHHFKMRNLSYTVPQWPFMPLQRSDDERIYVRFHSDEYETREIENVRSQATICGLLGESKQHVWNTASEIVLRRTAVTETEPQEPVAADDTARVNGDNGRSGSGRLWVEKYKPRKYIDLLSDEMTNRSLLFWLRMWDKMVFGREFKIKDENHTGEMNSFNKRTGKFESNGGWRQRKTRQTLNTNIDELGRPMQKVALLCGPPGLGKTTLAHTIARHAGYSVREINASDDRSPEAFKLALENGTQMSSVLNEDRRPNCIILDEIDGAPRQSIEFLVRFISDSVVAKVRPKGVKTPRNILKRPIICICNDVYDPALRPLRQIAFVVTFPPIESARLADRLVQVARRENLKTDFGSLIALAEKSGNDVRSCISTMQFFNAQKQELKLRDVLNSNMGQKDRHQGLFDIWSAIFRIQRPKKQLEISEACNSEEPQVTMSDTSVETRVRNVLDVLHSGGDYERLMQGVYENFLQQRMPDPNLNGICEALQWFSFSDMVQQKINKQQNYSIYPYLQFGFVAWHLLFASLAWPKINFPMRGIEFNQKSSTQKNIFQSFRRGIGASGAVGLGQGSALLVDTVPLLKRILSPHLRSVALQLLSPKEHYDLKHTVEVMADLGITYTQIKAVDGLYVFQMEPDLDLLAQFPDLVGIVLSYFGRQLIAREVALERMRRATPKSLECTNASCSTVAGRSFKGAQKTSTTKKTDSPKNLPNHLQRLNPKQIDRNANGKAAKETISRDFFGRIQSKTATNPATMERSKSSPDPIVKSAIWYRYKQGYNNAVRKDVHMRDLL